MTDINPASSDFTAAEPTCSEPLVQYLTEYSRVLVTQEETDAMLERVYGKGRVPGYEGRRWDRDQGSTPTHAEIKAEMETALEEARAQVEECE